MRSPRELFAAIGSETFQIVSEKLLLGNGNVPRQWLKAEERPHMPKGSDEDPMVKTIPWRLSSTLMVIAAAGRCTHDTETINRWR